LPGAVPDPLITHYSLLVTGAKRWAVGVGGMAW
jgi:hypothetical protein